MLNHSVEVFKEITDYLTWQHIPYRAYNPGGIVTFSASTTDSENLYDYRVNISKNDFWVEVTAPIKVPQAEKIQVRLLKFCNYVNRIDRSGGFLVLDRDAGKLLCHMTVPFAYDRCGRIDQLLPVPASMLNHYCGAIRRIIMGTTSVEMEVKDWKNIHRYQDISPLVSSSSLEPMYRFSTRHGFMDPEITEMLERYFSRETGEV